MTDLPNRAPERNRPPAGSERGAFGRAVPLGRWAGVPITAHWTVLATIVLFANVLAASALPALEPHRSNLAYWVTGTLTALVFLITLLAHELAHAVLARRYGMTVKRITLWMLGGFTELDGEPPSPRADALIAGIGPATSLLLGGVGVGVTWALGGPGLFSAALIWLAGANLLLGVFNLLPGAPLDGGRLLRALLWWRYRDRVRAAVNAARVGRVLGMLLVLLGFLETLAGGLSGLWLVLLGLFLQTAAVGEQTGAVFGRLTGWTVREVMAPVPAPVPDWWTPEQFGAVATQAHAAAPLLVLVDFPGEVSGVVGLRELQRLPAARRGEVRLRELTRLRGDRLLRVTADTLVEDLLPKLAAHGGVAVVVDEVHRPIGVVTGAELRHAARLAELGWQRPRHPDQAQQAQQAQQPHVSVD
jgi:Zn-dependent protease